LQQVKILDPACGSGNFLYVTLDLLKGLESEVLRRLEDVTGAAQLRLDINQVNPSQFLGIEINPRAAAIADLVIWIGYLQWHFRRFGDLPPIEPVLREYKNIECRDAVLAYDGMELLYDDEGNPITRWDGISFSSHPVTGKKVPDETKRVQEKSYIQPRKGVWPNADYIIGNPPFIGKINMRDLLGDGYVKSLRKVYKEIPDSADYVMYWWHQSAELLKNRTVNRFGLISTNSLRQIYNRKVIQPHIDTKNNKGNVSIIFAVPDHPWVETSDGAAVRIAMTVATLGAMKGKRATVHQESYSDDDSGEAQLIFNEMYGIIQADLSVGVPILDALPLKSNILLANTGLTQGSRGFILDKSERDKIVAANSRSQELLFIILNGRDITERNRNLFTIDTFGWSQEDLLNHVPEIYQHLFDNVYPDRQVNPDPKLRKFWWLARRSNEKLRNAISRLNRYVATSLTAKHRVFVFIETGIRSEISIAIIASEDAYHLGVLSSRVHVTWSLAAGGRLGVGNDPRYNNSVCFDPFPFPDATDTQKQTIRELGERLDSHRKRVQTAHPEVTITAMYNLLEQLRKGEPLNDKDKAFNQKALVSTLKQIHDELDTAVFAAYGWETTITDDQILENLVTLNAQRAEEERNGHIRWLRPDYQSPGETYVQPTLEGITTETETAIVPTEQQPFPKTLKEQLSAIRDLFRTQSGEWTATQVTAHFKAANRKQKVILDCLESLEDLGILLSHDEGGVTFWHLAEVENAG
jgi:hypothetical protein